MTSGEITYDPVTNDRIMTLDDGTVFTFNSQDQLVRVEEHAGVGGPVTSVTEYSDWYANGDPKAGHGPDGDFTIAYPDGGRQITMSGDGTVFTFNSQDQLVRVEEHAGVGGPVTSVTEYSDWYANGDPKAGHGPDGDFTIAYPDGGRQITMSGDGTVFTFNSQDQLVRVEEHAGVGGPLTSVTEYSDWYANGDPKAGHGPDGDFTIAYPDGGRQITMSGDGTVFTFNSQDQLVRVEEHAGVGGPLTSVTEYSDWYANGDPKAGHGPDGDFTIAYPDGGRQITMSGDGTVFTFNSQDQLVRVEEHAGVGGPVTSVTEYSDWYANGDPKAGHGPDGDFTIAYPDGGRQITMSGDGTVFTFNSQDQLVRVEEHAGVGGPLTSATDYTDWYPNGDPKAGHGPDGDFTIAYPDGGRQITMSGDGTVFTFNSQDQLVRVEEHAGVGGPLTSATDYTDWYPNGDPKAGHGPDGDFTIAYPDGGRQITMSGDGTVFTFNSQDQLVRVEEHAGVGGPLTSATDYTDWYPNGDPKAGHGPDGDFTIAYPDGGRQITMSGDGTVFTFNSQDQLVRVEEHAGVGGPLTSATDYTDWYPNGDPKAGHGPDGDFRIAYPDGGRQITMSGDGTVFTFNSQDQLVRVEEHAGVGGPLTSVTEYSDWYANGDPKAGHGPDGDFTIAYPDGGRQITMSGDGTVFTFNSQDQLVRVEEHAGVGGPLTSVTEYSDWYANGDPKAGHGPDGDFTIAYPDGGRQITMSGDGTVFTFNSQDQLVRVEEHAGVGGPLTSVTDYTDWYPNGDPKAGHGPDGDFTIAYPDGGRQITMSGDGTVFTFNSQDQLVRVEEHAGVGGPLTSATDYTDWYPNGDPKAGHGPDGDFTIAYPDGGRQITMSGDGTVFTFNSQDQLVRVEEHAGVGGPLTSATDYTDWYPNGDPKAGHGPDGDFTIAYPDGGRQITMSGDGTVFTLQSQDQLVRVEEHAGVGGPLTSATDYSDWYPNGDPKAGHGPDGDFTIVPLAGGGQQITMAADGTVYIYNADHQLIRVEEHAGVGGPLTSATDYSDWYPNGDPKAGHGPDGDFTIVPLAGGGQQITMAADGTVYIYNADHQLIRVEEHAGVGGPLTSATDYSDWYPNGDPKAGHGPDGDFTIVPLAGGGQQITMAADGTVYIYNADHQLIRVEEHAGVGGPLTSATDYSDWYPNGDPKAGHGPDGDFTIVPLAGGGQQITMAADGTVYIYNADHQLIRVEEHAGVGGPLTSATDYSDWYPNGDPKAGHGPDGDFTIVPLAGGGQQITMAADGTVYIYNADHQLIRVEEHAGVGGPLTSATDYSDWYPNGDPKAGHGPDGDFTIVPLAGGGQQITMAADGTVYIYNADHQLIRVEEHAGVGGPLTSATDYSDWYPNGDPKAGHGPDGDFTIVPLAGGGQQITMAADGTVYIYNADHQLIRVEEHAGVGGPLTSATDYSDWYPNGDPKAGHGPDGDFTIVPLAGGGQQITMAADGTVYIYNADHQLIRVEEHAGVGGPLTSATDYSDWYPNGDPKAGHGPDGDFTIVPLAGGGQQITMAADGTVYIYNADHQLIRVEEHAGVGGPLTSATDYSDWYPNGDPKAGHGPNGDFTIVTDPATGITTTTYSSGLVEMVGPDGKPMEVQVPIPGKPGQFVFYTNFDENGQPIAGHDPQGSFTISHDPKTGFQTVTYKSGPAEGEIDVYTQGGQLVYSWVNDPHTNQLVFVDWKVEFGELIDAHSRLPTYIREIEAATDGVDTQLNSVTESTWSSPASDSFTLIKNQYGPYKDDLVAALWECHRAMGDTITNLIDSEAINMDNINIAFAIPKPSP